MKIFIKNVLAWLQGLERKCESQAVKALRVKPTLSSQPKPLRKVAVKKVAAKKVVAKKVVAKKNAK
jgi:hypothetical protein